MATTVEAVHAHLKRDPALAEVLVRDLLRLRRTARRLIEEHGWDTSEEAVVSALRRYAEDREEVTTQRSRRALADNRVDARGGLALLTVPRLYQVQTHLLEAWRSGNVRDIIAILPSHRSLRLLIEASNVLAFRQQLADETVEEVREPLTAVTLACDGASAEVTVASLGLTALMQEGIDVIEVLSSGGECTFLVHDEQRMLAFDVLSELTEPCVSP